jgi:LemA protein
MALMGYLIIIYNRFASLRAGIDASWSDIEVQLKRRYDLIPALLETVKGYKEYESKTLEDIIRVRQEGLGRINMEEIVSSANEVSGSLVNVFALSEAYPELKANTIFVKLQEELSLIEDTLQSARRYYNAMVRDYNYRLESFPDMLIAKRFNYVSCEYFELSVYEIKDAYKMPKITL